MIGHSWSNKDEVHRVQPVIFQFRCKRSYDLTDPLTITAQDHDWYKATTTDQADAISNDIYTMFCGETSPQKKLDVSDTRADILLKTTRGEALSNEVLSSLLFYNSDQSTMVLVERIGAAIRLTAVDAFEDQD